MCEPTTLALVAAGAKSLQLFGQRQQTKATFGALATQRRAQSEEISARAGASLGERVKSGRAEQARLRVAAGEAGVAGQSVDVAALDVGFQQDADLGTITLDARFAQRGSEARFLSGIASQPNPGVLSNALQVASAGATGFAVGSGLQIPITKTATKAGGGFRGI